MRSTWLHELTHANQIKISCRIMEPLVLAYMYYPKSWGIGLIVIQRKKCIPSVANICLKMGPKSALCLNYMMGTFW